MGAQVDAVRRVIRQLPEKERKDATAALALYLAGKLDDGPPWREIGPIAAQLRAVLGDLAGRVTPQVQADPLNDLQKQRAKRRGEAG